MRIDSENEIEYCISGAVLHVQYIYSFFSTVYFSVRKCLFLKDIIQFECNYHWIIWTFAVKWIDIEGWTVHERSKLCVTTLFAVNTIDGMFVHAFSSIFIFVWNAACHRESAFIKNDFTFSNPQKFEKKKDMRFNVNNNFVGWFCITFSVETRLDAECCIQVVHNMRYFSAVCVLSLSLCL